MIVARRTGFSFSYSQKRQNCELVKLSFLRKPLFEEQRVGIKILSDNNGYPKPVKTGSASFFKNGDKDFLFASQTIYPIEHLSVASFVFSQEIADATLNFIFEVYPSSQNTHVFYSFAVITEFGEDTSINGTPILITPVRIIFR